MKVPPIPNNESERLASLYEYDLLDTPCEHIFDTVTQLAASVCHVPMSLINLIDKNRLWSKSSFGLDHTESPRETSFCAHVLSETDIMEVPNALHDERFSDNPLVLNDPKIRFYAGVPLINSEGFSLGTLCVIDDKEKKLSESQKENLRRLSKIVISMFELKKTIRTDLLKRSQMNEVLSKANEKLKINIDEQKIDIEFNIILGQMNDLLQSCTTETEAYIIIEKFCLKLFPGTSGSLYLMDTSHEYVTLIRQWESPNSFTDLFPKMDCWGLRRGELHYATNPKTDLTCHHFIHPDRSAPYLCLPLIAQGEILGLLCIEYDIKNRLARALKSNRTQYLSIVRAADQIALSLANIKLRETLRHQSTCDPLTGLYNRRYLSQVINRELTRAKMNALNLGILLIDIDYFKKFNDTYGHDAGDLVLIEVAKILKNTKNHNDIACRLGGEEFMLLVHDAGEKQLIAMANTLRENIRETKMQYAGQSLGRITFSIGIAMFPRHGDSLDALINAADNALYEVKESGRDNVMMYDENK